MVTDPSSSSASALGILTGALLISLLGPVVASEEGMAMAAEAAVADSPAAETDWQPARCILVLNRIGARAAGLYGRGSLHCLRGAARSDGGDSAGGCAAQVFAATVRSRLDRLREARRSFCGRVDQFPEHAHAGADQVAAAAEAAARAISAGLFGVADDAVVGRSEDENGARCQAEVLQAAQRIFRSRWRSALRSWTFALDGGSSGDLIVSRERLQTLTLGSLDTDRRSARTGRRVGHRKEPGNPCEGTATSLEALFPGCRTNDVAGVFECAERVARCQFCQSVNAFNELELECDEIDDGEENSSCTPALCSGAAAGVNWAAAGAACPRLSDYGLFEGGSPHAPRSPGVRYVLTTPLFSDYAAKDRVVFVPPGRAAVYGSERPLEFPVGTILVKTFSFPKDPARPDLGETLIETRLLVHRHGGWQAFPYVWDAEAREAYLEPDGATRLVTWNDGERGLRQIDYHVPSVRECASCHGTLFGLSPIGPKAALLNRRVPYEDGEHNQLEQWSRLGILSGAPPAESAPRLPVWDDPADGSLEDRARAYLEINCAHCHREAGMAGFTGLLLGAANPLGESSGICKPARPLQPSAGGETAYVIVPGSPDSSVLIQRVRSTTPFVRMPLIGRSVVHEEGVALLEEWIASLDGSCD